MVGCQYDELTQTLDDEELEQLNTDLNDGVLDYASPWYDADREDWFVGYCVSKQTDADKLGFLIGEINVSTNDFKNRFKSASHLIKIKACANVM